MHSVKERSIVCKKTKKQDFISYHKDLLSHKTIVGITSMVCGAFSAKDSAAAASLRQCYAPVTDELDAA